MQHDVLNEASRYLLSESLVLPQRARAALGILRSSIAIATLLFGKVTAHKPLRTRYQWTGKTRVTPAQVLRHIVEGTLHLSEKHACARTAIVGGDDTSEYWEVWQ